MSKPLGHTVNGARRVATAHQDASNHNCSHNANGMASGIPVTYDPIGNRVSASETIGGETLLKSYTANELNQYTTIANSDAVGLRGDATNSAVVTVNGQAVQSDNIASDTVPWHFALEADNASGSDFPFAEIMAVVNPPDTFRYRFSTKYYDAETGLYYYGYRFYAPSLHRWLNRDPIGKTIDPLLYAYCVNSPINLIDPDGQSIWSIIDRFRARLEQLRQLVHGARVGLEVRSRFLDMIDQYVCCPASGEPCRIDEYDGVLNGTPTSWTIAHRITGCRLKGEGVSLENMALLNGIHETFEFFRLWRPEVFAFIDWDEVGSYDQLVNAISQSVFDYLNDTVSDIVAVREGFDTDGTRCYERFIPDECFLITQ